MKLREIRELWVNNPQTPEDRRRNEADTNALQQFLVQQGLEKGNFLQEVEMTYDYVEAQYDSSNGPELMSMHSHPFYEIIFVKHGHIQYLVGTDRHRIQPGDILMIPPGISHCPLLLSEMAEPYDRLVIWMSQRYVSELMIGEPELRNFCQTASLIRPDRRNREHLEALFTGIIEECERKETGWQLAMIAGTTGLLIDLLRGKREALPQQQTAENPELLDEILLYIEDNLSSRITLEETARHFLVSTSRVKQIFSTQLGTSFYRSVTARRLIEAKNQIMAGKALEEVAENVGFGDYTSFYRAFRKEFGIAPSKYREITSGVSQNKSYQPAAGPRLSMQK